MSYKQAKGAIPWQEGDEPPEDLIRRIRGDTSKPEEENARLREENKRLRIALDLTTHDEYYIKGFNEDELRRRLRHINQLVEKTLGEDLEEK